MKKRIRSRLDERTLEMNLQKEFGPKNCGRLATDPCSKQCLLRMLQIAGKPGATPKTRKSDFRDARSI